MSKGCLIIGLLFFGFFFVVAISSGSWKFIIMVFIGLLFFVFGTGGGKLPRGR